MLTLVAVSMPASGQDVVFRGLLHSPLGNATLAVNAQDRLVVGNIGTRGGDGVSIDVVRASSFSMDLLQFPPGLPPGSQFEFFADGTVAGTPNLRVAELRGTMTTALRIRLDAEFPGLTPAPKAVEVYFEGILVGTMPFVTTDQVATVPSNGWPTTFAIRREVIPQQRPALVCEWPGPTLITLNNGTIVSGDELRVVVLTPTNDLDFVAQSGGTGSDVPDFFIDGEDVEPQCPGDVNGDGVVDLLDLATLLSNFGRMGDILLSEGNLDQDDDVDIADLAELLGNFGNACD
jgi:hypothetical protein